MNYFTRCAPCIKLEPNWWLDCHAVPLWKIPYKSRKCQYKPTLQQHDAKKGSTYRSPQLHDTSFSPLIRDYFLFFTLTYYIRSNAKVCRWISSHLNDSRNGAGYTLDTLFILPAFERYYPQGASNFNKCQCAQRKHPVNSDQYSHAIH